MTTDAAGAALDDPTTASALHIHRHQLRGVRSGLWLWSLCLVAAVAIVFSLRSVPMVWRLVLFLVAAVPLLRLLAESAGLLWAGRRQRPVERVLAEQPWRTSPAKVLTWGRSAVLELPGLGCVRLENDAICLRRSVDLAGQVDVAGPGPSGWVALRLPGVCTPLPARVVAAVPADPLPPPIAAPTGSAAYPVLAHCGPAWRRGAQQVMAMYALCVVFGAAVAALLTEQEWSVHVGLGIAALWVGMAAVARYWSYLLVRLRLPAQLAAAPWSAFPASLDAWEAPTGYATANGLLHLPDGRVAWYTLPGADYDLLVAIAMSGVVHVVGTPEPGAVLPVGVPERPLFGYALFTAVSESSSEVRSQL